MEILTNARKKKKKTYLKNSCWNFHPKNGSRATEAPPSGCYKKSIRVSPLVLLFDNPVQLG